MITRPRIRRAACWVGVFIGALSLLALGVSVFIAWNPIRDTERVVYLRRGAVEVYWQDGLVRGQSGTAYPRAPFGTRWRWIPKWVEQRAFGVGDTYYRLPGEFIVPLWVPAAFGLLCVYWLLPARGPRHMCEKCGYDLRELPRKDGGAVCPECGMVA